MLSICLLEITHSQLVDKEFLAFVAGNHLNISDMENICLVLRLSPSQASQPLVIYFFLSKQTEQLEFDKA